MDGKRVLGVDGCKKGWVGIALGEGRVSAYFATRIDDLVSAAQEEGDLEVVTIDIPIGLPDHGRRDADLLAYKEVGPRRSSVFMTPTRAALEADDHASAVVINLQLANEKLTVQAFGLKEKLLQVDRWVRQARQQVFEVHPELCFARLAGAPLPFPKTVWAGAEHRRALLAGAGIVIPGDIGRAGALAKVDDVLDAAVAAWTARRITLNQARSLPSPPQTFSDGLPCAIWA